MVERGGVEEGRVEKVGRLAAGFELEGAEGEGGGGGEEGEEGEFRVGGHCVRLFLVEYMGNW